MGSMIVGAILVIIVAIAVYGTVRRIRYGSSCCGEHDPADKRIKVKDKNKANYPFSYSLKVDGMHCSNCALRVENSLNRSGFRWARADVGNKTVSLLSKQEENENELRNIIAQAGYTVLSIRKTQ
ncbi:MAG: cation transporter [Lachnospiraceae bacterium]|nr:cation transporter [Lachnospiraceae bacterium]